MVEAIDFRNAMSLLTSAVNVITTTGISGHHGFTASAVCSVTDTPGTLLVCMNTSSRSYEHFVDSKILTVNVLAAHQQQISQVFASKLSSKERFEHGDWSTLVTGAPVLAETLVSFDCKIDQIQEIGTHAVFMCTVVAIQQNSAKAGLVYFNRAYHQVGHQDTV
ncbi:flavin reductase [Acinetobacter sp. B5B]|uniref:flavin reductase family protein n=1 Tax=Acinetobacter baretiae TaxID=2605383 RepID=UPI0018C22C00|nr:flavin reductase family protein [Acinetobacter baretiae]MBF7682657.1 flavin reductase [Acinetobacter baretiae]MBF7685640.1 flavin reductase [Acinetobacter baretiae]